MSIFQIHKFSSVKSTNDTARKYPVNTIIIADAQTNGRGRFNRKWSSKNGGIYLSIVIKPLKDNLGIATFLSALAVNNMLKKISLNAEIKWPNDILFSGKKLCGILSESFIIGNEKKMIIGIGINVNNSLSQELNAISLKKIFNKALDKDKLISIFIYEFQYLYKTLYLKNKFNKIVMLFKAKCGTLGKRVSVKTINGEFIGRAEDINSDCNLVILLNDGTKKTIVEGDIQYLD